MSNGFQEVVGMPVSIAQKQCAVMYLPDATTSVTIPAGGNLELPKIITEYGRSMPEAWTPPDEVTLLMNPIMNSKVFDFIMWTNLVAGHNLRIDISEAESITGVQTLRKRMFANQANVEFTYRAINNVVFIIIYNLAAADITDGEIRIVSRPE